jgi:hypothetical protein
MRATLDHERSCAACNRRQEIATMPFVTMMPPTATTARATSPGAKSTPSAKSRSFLSARKKFPVLTGRFEAFQAGISAERDRNTSSAPASVASAR